MGFLSILTGITPVFWVIIGAALLVLELASRTRFILHFVIAAGSTGLILFAYPPLTGGGQTALFCGVSVVSWLLAPVLFRRIEAEAALASATNAQSSRYSGVSAIVTKFAKGEGIVDLGGTRWRARWLGTTQAEPGDVVRVLRKEGMILYVDTV